MALPGNRKSRFRNNPERLLILVVDGVGPGSCQSGGSFIVPTHALPVDRLAVAYGKPFSISENIFPAEPPNTPTPTIATMMINANMMAYSTEVVASSSSSIFFSWLYMASFSRGWWEKIKALTTPAGNPTFGLKSNGLKNSFEWVIAQHLFENASYAGCS